MLIAIMNRKVGTMNRADKVLGIEKQAASIPNVFRSYRIHMVDDASTEYFSTDDS